MKERIFSCNSEVNELYSLIYMLIIVVGIPLFIEYLIYWKVIKKRQKKRQKKISKSKDRCLKNIIRIGIRLFIRSFRLDHKSLSSQRVFRLSIYLPIGLFFGLGWYVWNGCNLSLSAEGYNNFYQISKLPIAILTISIPLGVLIARLHSTKQTEIQIKQARRQISNTEKQIRMNEDNNKKSKKEGEMSKILLEIKDCERSPNLNGFFYYFDEIVDKSKVVGLNFRSEDFIISGKCFSQKNRNLKKLIKLLGDITYKYELSKENEGYIKERVKDKKMEDFGNWELRNQLENLSQSLWLTNEKLEIIYKNSKTVFLANYPEEQLIDLIEENVKDKIKKEMVIKNFFESDN